MKLKLRRKSCKFCESAVEITRFVTEEERENLVQTESERDFAKAVDY